MQPSMLLKNLAYSVHILARQGLPLCGDGKMVVDSNLSQLLVLQCRNNDEQLAEWLRRKSNKYTGHDMQNEMLQVMALHILQKIALSLQSTKFTIMVDETTDVSTNEQVVIVLCWVDQHLDVHKDFCWVICNRLHSSR